MRFHEEQWENSRLYAPYACARRTHDYIEKGIGQLLGGEVGEKMKLEQRVDCGITPVQVLMDRAMALGPRFGSIGVLRGQLIVVHLASCSF